jgi:hypothetical protein
VRLAAFVQRDHWNIGTFDWILLHNHSNDLFDSVSVTATQVSFDFWETHVIVYMQKNRSSYCADLHFTRPSRFRTIIGHICSGIDRDNLISCPYLVWNFIACIRTTNYPSIQQPPICEVVNNMGCVRLVCPINARTKIGRCISSCMPTLIKWRKWGPRINFCRFFHTRRKPTFSFFWSIYILIHIVCTCTARTHEVMHLSSSPTILFCSACKCAPN